MGPKSRQIGAPESFWAPKLSARPAEPLERACRSNGWANFGNFKNAINTYARARQYRARASPCFAGASSGAADELYSYRCAAGERPADGGTEIVDKQLMGAILNHEHCAPDLFLAARAPDKS